MCKKSTSLFLCEIRQEVDKKMLEERIRRLENEKEKLEGKKEKITERLREISVKLENAYQEQKNEKNERLASMIEKNIGELSEEKIKILDGILQEQTEKFLEDGKGQEENFDLQPESKNLESECPYVQPGD